MSGSGPGLPAEVRRRTLEVGGTRLALLECGRGAPVVLLHGFPDNAWTWEHQFGPLAAAGYRAIAPYLPGYPPSGLPASGTIEVHEVIDALAALIEKVADGPAVLVGHDWGATLTYLLAAGRPELLGGAVAMAVPHPAASGQVLTHPDLIQENFHHWFFQLPDLPEAALEANDLAFVDYLWRSWSPSLDHTDHVERVKRETLSVPGAIAAAIDYYRAMFRAMVSGSLELQPTSVRTLVLFGADDPHQRLVSGQDEWFGGEYELEVIGGARHFLQREVPAEVTRLLLKWLSAPTLRH